jgi:hypothetical protein
MVMERPVPRRCGAFIWTGALLLGLAGFSGGVARADYGSWGMSTQEQQIYDYGPNGTNGSSKPGSILDSTNPIDLMNKIRKGTAMDDATPPSDAVDAALKELEVQSPAPSSQVKAP